MAISLTFSVSNKCWLKFVSRTKAEHPAPAQHRLAEIKIRIRIEIDNNIMLIFCSFIQKGIKKTPDTRKGTGSSLYFLNVFAFANVMFPNLPSILIPHNSWNTATAVSVFAPYFPSTVNPASIAQFKKF